MDGAFTVPASSLPTAADDVIASSGIIEIPIGGVTVANLTTNSLVGSYNINSTTRGRLTVTGTLTLNEFADFGQYSLTNAGNVVFNGYSACQFVTLNASGNVTFNGNSRWSTYSTLNVNEYAIFNGESSAERGSVINGNAIFNNNSGFSVFLYPCTINGSAVFNNNSFNGNGTVSGNATFNNNSYNNGTVAGNATFNNLTATLGNVVDRTGRANGIVGGKTIDSIGNTINSWTFGGSSIFYGKATGNVIFNDNARNEGTVKGTATFTSSLFYLSPVGTVEGTTFFSSPTPVSFVLSGDYAWGVDASNWIFATPAPTWNFNDHSYNHGTVVGYSTFNNNSYNIGLVNGGATFNGNSSNYDPQKPARLGTVNGPVTCNTTSYCPNPQSFLTLGDDSENYYRNLVGYIDEFRVTTGKALYTGNFPKPKSPFPDPEDDLQADIAIGFEDYPLDSSENKNAVGIKGRIQLVDDAPGSAYFPGNSSRITASSNDFVIGEKDFVLEFWIFPLSNIFRDLASLGGPSGLQIKSSDLRGGLSVMSDNRQVLASSEPLEIEKWQHLALVRETEASPTCCGSRSQRLKLYFDGSLVADEPFEKYLNTKDVVIAGGHPLLSFRGYMDDLRLAVGSSVYTTGFEPPTATPPPVVVRGSVQCINLQEYDPKTHAVCGGPYPSSEQCSNCNPSSSSSSSSSKSKPCFPEVIVTTNPDGSTDITVECRDQPNSSSTSCVLGPTPSPKKITCPDGSEIGETRYAPDFAQCEFVEQQFVYGSCDSSSSSQESSSSSFGDSSSSSTFCEDNERYCLYSNFSIESYLFGMDDKPPPCKTVSCCYDDGCRVVCEEDCISPAPPLKAGIPLKECPSFDCCNEGYCLYGCPGYGSQFAIQFVPNCLWCYGKWFLDPNEMDQYIEDNCCLECWECQYNTCEKLDPKLDASRNPKICDRYQYPKDWWWTGQANQECGDPYYGSQPECEEKCCECSPLFFPCTDTVNYTDCCFSITYNEFDPNTNTTSSVTKTIVYKI